MAHLINYISIILLLHFSDLAPKFFELTDRFARDESPCLMFLLGIEAKLIVYEVSVKTMLLKQR